MARKSSDQLETELLNLILRGITPDSPIDTTVFQRFVDDCMREGVTRYLARCQAFGCRHNHDLDHDV